VKASVKSDGSDHRDGLDYFVRVKFDQKAREFIKEITGMENCQKVIVLAKIHKGEESQVYDESERLGIKIWKIQDIIKELSKIPLKGSRDDILRIIELFSHIACISE
jgi:hypothetical protein